ncbi:MAG: RNA polymerase sigma-70 factor [Bacteroidota bacterium]
MATKRNLQTGKTYYLKNHQVFESLYQKHWKKLYSICFQRTHDVEASEEMVQDIFISLWKRWEEIELTSSVENYLFKAAKLKVIDYYRAEQRIKEVCTLQSNKASSTADQKVANTVEDIILEDHTRHLVDQLPERCQKVYKLSREKQLNTREIAFEMGISQKTVKNHLTKALGFLRLHILR